MIRVYDSADGRMVEASDRDGERMIVRLAAVDSLHSVQYERDLVEIRTRGGISHLVTGTVAELAALLGWAGE